eukprot:TRINITY_DN3620_c0_g1_i6.p1 TRINITY_DN3620_c0_g1~~TRINITY_DN3620_c0_g1_i6.p1  ORF type:complete len:989 (+),score=236.56 TRINITY_DN3620_c0_g1_i6:27-2993(+)
MKQPKLPHQLTLQETLQAHNANLDTGLTNEQAEERLVRHGKNRLKGEKVSVLMILLRQCLNVMMLILLIAVVLSFVVSQWIEAGVIVFVMVTNVTIGFVQEFKSERTMEALKKMSAPTARVLRNGVVESRSTMELVPGDVVAVGAGDVVSADVRFVNSHELYIDEAFLTGESEPIHKTIDAIDEEEVPLGDRTNLGFMGSVVVKGAGTGIVIATGMNTQIGKIATQLNQTKKDTKTRLQKNLEYMAYGLFIFACLISIAVFGANQWSADTEVVIYAISIAIAIIPEGLIAVVTITFAFGVKTMAKKNAVVRRMAALEALGNITDICSDKTGTLTQAKMVAVGLFNMESTYSISGVGVIPKGEMKDESAGEVLSKKVFPELLRLQLKTCALCNSASLIYSDDTPHAIDNEGRGVKTSGEPTEVALQVLAVKFNLGKEHLFQTGYHMVEEYQFSSTLKKMSVVIRNKKKYYVYSKGAPERLLENCTHILVPNKDENTYETKEITKKFLRTIQKANDAYTQKGLRVLALAYRPEIKFTKNMEREEVEKDLIFLGLVGIYDPPREQSLPAVKTCKTAGIVVHMATGDHISTASAIAKQVNILPPAFKKPDEQARKKSQISSDSDGKESSSQDSSEVDNREDHRVMLATAFDKLTEQELDEMEIPLVIARCSPETKVKIISALHRKGRVVAMTGDGVNDAPALKSADIGIAMGQSGSDVARNVADIVLVDDNFATIVDAIAEGRRTFDNITKFIIHLMSCNIAEVIALVICLFLQDISHRSVYVMSPLQILWLNMLTSSPPAIGLGLEKAHPKVMRRPPKRRHGFFSKEFAFDIMYYGVIMGALCVAGFMVSLYVIGDGQLGQNCNFVSDKSFNCTTVFKSRSVSFITLNSLFLIHAFNCKDTRDSLLNMRFWENKFLLFSVMIGFIVTIPTVYIPGVYDNVFKQAPIDIEWVIIVTAMILFVTLSELWKLFKRKIFKPRYNATTDDAHVGFV